MEVTLNLLFLPLLGGYLFYTRCHVTSYRAEKCDGHRLIFEAAACGFLFLIVARILLLCARSVPAHQAAIVDHVAYAAVGAAVSLVIGFAWTVVKIISSDTFKPQEYPKKFSLGLALGAIMALSVVLMTRITPKTIWDFAPNAALATACVCAPLLIIGFLAQSVTQDNAYKVYAHTMFVRMAMFAVIAGLLAVALAANFPEARTLWHRLSPFEDSSTPVLAFLLAFISTIILNLLLIREVAIERVHRDYRSNALERLIFEAATTQDQIQISLRDGKVYVGWIEWLPLNPQASDAYLQILPTVSGYRDPITKQLRLPTNYGIAYERPDFEPADYIKVIPIADIVSASKFIEEVYARFQQAAAQRSSPHSEFDIDRTG